MLHLGADLLAAGFHRGHSLVNGGLLFGLPLFHHGIGHFLGGVEGHPHRVLCGTVFLNLVHQDLHLVLQGDILLVQGAVILDQAVQKVVHLEHIVAAKRSFRKDMGFRFLGC